MPSISLGLLPHQAEADEASEPFLAMVTGVGGGKTHYGSRWLLRRAVAFPESLHLATGNTYPQIRDVIVPALIEACDELRIAFTYRKVDNELHLHLGDIDALIIIRSTEKYDMLRGIEIASWWADEVRDCKRDAVDVLMGRMRSTRCDKPKYLWTTTPNGFDHIYARHVDSGDPNYRLITAKSADNPFLSDEYIDALTKSYDEFMVRQELGGEFINLAGGCLYYSFSRTDNVTETVDYDPDQALIICCDQNPDPLAMVLVQKGPRNEVWCVDEIGIRHGTVVQASEVLRARYEGHDAGLIIYGDAYGGKESAQTGRSDYEAFIIALRIWYTGRIVSRVRNSNPPITDRVNAMNAMCHNAAGERRLFLNPRCNELRQDFEQIRPMKGVRHPDKKQDSMRTHWSDAVGYYIAIEYPVTIWDAERERMEGLPR